MSARCCGRDLDPLAADPCLELVCRAPGDDPAVVDDGDLVRELIGLLEVLGREEERRPFADLLADHVPHAQAAARIEAGGRLVEEQESRATDERSGEVEAPTHAAGVRLRHGRRVAEPELLEGSSARRRASPFGSW